MQEELSDILRNKESLEHFVEAMKEFNQAFCDAMASGVDFTIKIQVRGNAGTLEHVKVDSNSWRRSKLDKKKMENYKKGLKVS